MSVAPLHVFRFHVDFTEQHIGSEPGSAVTVCSGAFSDCTGLEATMEPKVIQEGGRNYGAAQRVGKVTFATVILKRGITPTSDLWTWFSLVNGGSYDHRRTATITIFDDAGNGVIAWKFLRALPTKFKTADLKATGGDVGVEELHFVHEGLFTATPRAQL